MKDSEITKFCKPINLSLAEIIDIGLTLKPCKLINKRRAKLFDQDLRTWFISTILKSAWNYSSNIWLI